MTGRPGDPAGAPPPEGMGPGAAVSGALHAGVIMLAIFGGQLFEADEAHVLQIAEVDIISGDAFDAALSSAPEGPRDPAAQVQAPEAGEEAPSVPDADAAPERPDAAVAEAPSPQDDAPDLSALDRPPPAEAPEPEAAPPAPEAGAEDSPPRGTATLASPLPAGPDRPDAVQRDAPPELDAAPPREADRVAPTPAEAPETIADAAEKVEETAPDPEAEPVEETPEPETAAAPREATSQIVTEADETSDEVKPAPVASAIPRGRPDAVTAAAQRKAEETEKPVETAAAEPETPKPAEEPAAKPAAESAEKPAERTPRRATAAPLGAKLTSGEVEGVRLGIESKWRKGLVTSMSNYEELVVTVRITLDQGGGLVGAPEPVSPLPDSRFKRAFDIAARALRQAAPFKLPPEKYGRWKVIEVTFNPAKGISGVTSG